MTLMRFASTGLLVGAFALAGCGGGSTESAGSEQATADRKAATAEAAQVEAQAAAEERAAAKREAAAKRKAAAQKVERAEARDRRRGDALLQSFVAAESRERWSIMYVSVEGGGVTVHTDLPPGNGAAFTGACTQLIDAEPWIETIKVTGTDGESHATWASGDASCQAPG
jgi:hypothetical protein